jgi:hypothetical protein
VDLGCGNGLLVFILSSEASSSDLLSLMTPARFGTIFKTSVSEPVLDRYGTYYFMKE